MRKTFWKHCTHPPLLKTAIKTAFIVGTILALINHFDSIIEFSLSGVEVLQILITYLVPFSVATFAAAKHAERTQQMEDESHHHMK